MEYSVKKKLIHELEKECERLHNATRTDIPFLSPVHNLLRSKLPFYYDWSTSVKTPTIHRVGVLGFIASFLFFTILQFLIPNLFIPEVKPVLAGSHTITWDALGDFDYNAVSGGIDGDVNWETNPRTNVSVTTGGNLQLAPTLDLGTGNDCIVEIVSGSPTIKDVYELASVAGVNITSCPNNPSDPRIGTGKGLNKGEGSYLNVNTNVPNFYDLTIKAGATLTTTAPAGANPGQKIEFKVSGTLTVESTGKIDASGKGYGGGYDTGKGSNGTTCIGKAGGGGGGGYGGTGGGGGYVGSGCLGAGGASYTSFPDFGSGGGTGYNSGAGGAGGGSVVIQTNNLTIQGSALAILADGNLGADAVGTTTGGSGSGSGGSIYIISANNINSSNLISAKGGNATSAGLITNNTGGGGGGAGGLIKIQAPNSASLLPIVSGGTGSTWNYQGKAGGAGVYTPENPSWYTLGTLGGTVATDVGLRKDFGASPPSSINWQSITSTKNALAAGEAVKFLVRTSPDKVTWTYYGYSGSFAEADIVTAWSSNYFGQVQGVGVDNTSMSTSGLPSAPARYFEILVRLESSGSSTPVLDAVTLTYNTMDPPQDTDAGAQNYLSQHRADDNTIITKGTGYTNQNQIKIKGTNLHGMDDGTQFDFQVELRPVGTAFNDTDCTPQNSNAACKTAAALTGVLPDAIGPNAELTFDLNFPDSSTYKWRARLIQHVSGATSIWNKADIYDSTDFTVEQTAPTGGSFVITKTTDADGTDSQYTKDLLVKLTSINSSDPDPDGAGPQQPSNVGWMQFSNNGTSWGTTADSGTGNATDTQGNCTSPKQWDGATCWTAYASTFSNWNLLSTGGPTKNVYAKFKDGAGNVSSTVFTSQNDWNGTTQGTDTTVSQLDLTAGGDVKIASNDVFGTGSDCDVTIVSGSPTIRQIYESAKTEGFLSGVNLNCSGTIINNAGLGRSNYLNPSTNIPNFNSLTINNGATLTTVAPSGANPGDKLEFKALSLDIQTGGTINANGKGYAGGNGSVNGSSSGSGYGHRPGSAGACFWSRGAGGGGYGNNGGMGGVAVSPGVCPGGASGGTSYNYGDSIPITYFGSGGGGGGSCNPGIGEAGGNSGGAVKISAASINTGGNIYADGSSGGNGSGTYSSGGGGGSGGSIYIVTNSINVNLAKFSARGGSGGSGTRVSSHGGGGGGGRVIVESPSVASSPVVSGGTTPGCSVAGSTTTPAYQHTATTQQAYSNSGTLGAIGNGLRIGDDLGSSKYKWTNLKWSGGDLGTDIDSYKIGIKVRPADAWGSGSYVNPSDGSASFYYLISGTFGTIPLLSSFANTKTFEIQLQLEGDGNATPTLSDLTIEYAASDEITYDATPPTISGVSDTPDPFSPEVADTVKDTSTISYTISDDISGTSLATYVRIYNAGAELKRTLVNGAARAQQTYNDLWDGKDDSLALLPSGTYTYKIDTQDLAGNNATQQTGTITVDNTLPVVSSLTLSDVSPTKAGSVTVTIDFTDTSGMDNTTPISLSFGTNGPDFNQCSTLDSDFSNITYTGNTWTGTVNIPTCGSTDGTNTIKVTGAKDNAGNTMAQNTVNTFVIDTVNPVEGSNPFVLQSTSSFVTNKIKQNDTYYIYANALDPDPTSDIKTVTANASTLTTGQTAASLAYTPTPSTPYNIGGISYYYRSSQLTADAGLTNGFKNITLTTTDNADNIFTSNSYSITADSEAPTVQGSVIVSDITPTKAGTVTFTVNFSEDMNTSTNPTVTFGTSDPYNQRNINQSMAWNTPTQWQGSVIISNDGTWDGLNIIKVTGAKDEAGNNQTENTETAFTIDTVKPVVSNVTSITANGAYNAGKTIVIEVTFTDAHNLQVTGTPRLKMNIGVPDRYANFVSLNGKTLTFNYVVQAGENSADLDYTDINSLDLNTGTIKDEADNDATLTLPSPTASGSLSFNKDIIIDTDAPNQPAKPDLDVSDDNGAYDDDDITNKNTDLHLSGTAEENSSVQLFDNGLSLEGPVIVNTNCSLGICGWSIIISSTLVEGPHNLTVKATDAAGNISDISNPLLVTIDRTFPSDFNLSTPITWDWVNTLTPTLNWEDTTEANFLKYEVYIDGALKSSITNISTPQWTLDYNLTEGLHTWDVKALDLADHTTLTLSGAFNVQVDVTKPTSMITSPATGLYTNASILDFAGRADRNDSLSNITNVDISINGGLGYLYSASDTAVNPNPYFYTWSWGWTTPTGADGPYIIQTRAKDQALNEEQSPEADAITINIDKTPVTGGSVNDGVGVDKNWTNSTSSLSSNWSGFSDANGIFKYKYAIQRANDSYYWDGANNFSSSEYWVDNNTSALLTVSSNLTLAPGQIYRIRVKAYDPTMSESNATIVNSNGISVDTSLPSSTVNMNDYYGPNTWNATSISGTALDNGIAPAGPSGLSKTEISARRNSDNQYWTGSVWSSDNIERWLNVGNSSSWTYDLPFANLTNNVSYTITSKSEDTAGNIQSPVSTDTFIYDNTTTAPTLNIGSNLTLNSSFEKDEDSNGNPDNWGGVSYINNGYSGGRSLRITTSGSFARQNIQVKAGVTYTQSAYIKGSGSARIGNTSGSGVNNTVTIASLSSEWTRYSSTFTAASQGNAELTLILDSGSEAQFDAVQLEEGSLTYYKDDNYIKDTNWTSSAITGTAIDSISGIQKTEIRIKRSTDNYYWNPTLNSGNGNWQSGEYWIDAGNPSVYAYGEAAGQMLKANAGFLDNTTYTVEARTVDNVNNTSTSVIDSVLWDSARPSTVVTNLTGQLLNSSTYLQSDTIKGTASDAGGSGISRTEITVKNTNPSGNPDYNKYWSGSSWDSTLTWLNVGNSANWTYQGLSSANLNDGSTFAITAKTFDQSSNEPLSEVSGTFIYDNSAPLSGANPLLAAGTSDTQVTLTWDLWTDSPAGVKNYKIYRSTNPSSHSSDNQNPLNEGIYNGTPIADINVSDINSSTKETGDTASLNAGVYTYEDNNLSMGWYYYKMVAYDSIDNTSSFVRSHSKTNFLPKIGTTESNIDLLANTSNNNILSDKSTVNLTGNASERTVTFNWSTKDQDHNNPISDITDVTFTVKKPNGSVLETFSANGSSVNGSWVFSKTATVDTRGFNATATFQFASSLPYGTYTAYATTKDIIPSHVVDSNTSSISLPPVQVEDLNAIGTNQSSSVRLTWKPPVNRPHDSQLSGISKYLIQRRINVDGSNFATVKELIIGSVDENNSYQPDNSYIYYDQGLTVLEYYRYQIVVVDVSDVQSSTNPVTDPVTVPDTSDPDPITDLEIMSMGATSSSASVTLSWSVPNDNSESATESTIQTIKGVQKFNIYRKADNEPDFVLIGTVDRGNATLVNVGEIMMYEDTNLPTATVYHYLVTALDAGLPVNDSYDPNETTKELTEGGNYVQTSTLATPSNLKIKSVSDSLSAGNARTFISWDPLPSSYASAPNPYNFSNFIIERKIDNDSWSELSTVGDIATSYKVDDHLDPDKIYHYRIKVKNAANYQSSPSNEVSMRPDSIDVEKPVISFTNQSISEDIGIEPGVSSSVVKWKTNEPADSIVEYKKEGESEYRKGVIDPKKTDKLNHSIILPSLTQKTKYYFKLKSKDLAGNEQVSQEYFFTTLSLDVSIPEVKTTSTSATISWTTNMASSSQIEYQKQGVTASSKIDGSPNLVKDHTVILKGLTVGRYTYKIKSVDNDNNIAESSLLTFEIPSTDKGSLSTPQTGKVEEKEITATSAKVTWESTIATTSWVDYGTTSGSYTMSAGDNSFATRHIVTLQNLIPDTSYYYRVKGYDANGIEYISEEYILKALAEPSISDIKIKEITPYTVVITWNTNIKTDSGINYGTSLPYPKREQSQDFTTFHELTLKNLTDQTSYQFQIEVKDEYGHIAKSENKTLTTPLDTTGPKISEVKLTPLQGGDQSKRGVIVSWLTDKESTSQLEYSSGVTPGRYDKKTPVDPSYNVSHTIIISDLEPGTTYHFRVISKDRRGNEGKSQDFTMLTQEKEESILNLILKTLEDTFSWVGKVQEFIGTQFGKLLGK